MAVLTGAVIGLLSQFSFGRSLLKSHPRFFSFGFYSKEGPSREMAENTNFVTTIVGRGWKTRSEDPKANHPNKPERKVILSKKSSLCKYTRNMSS